VAPPQAVANDSKIQADRYDFEFIIMVFFVSAHSYSSIRASD
jgi:hypothetical protein